jgi:peptidoglycan/LPS O-acetylase OafA/YrhL
MAIFCLEAALIQSVVPFYKRAVAQEMADRSHYTQLDGLRGLLALGVFFTHSLSFHYWSVSGRWDVPPSHFYAQLAIAPVAMFFIITGFLFWTKAQNGSLGNLGVYFVHRIRRLFPAYLFSLFVVVVVVAALTDFEIRVSLGSLLKSFVAYLSFSLIPGPPLNGLNGAALINANVFWSLRVEWMFYIILPVLALLARTKWNQLLLLLLSIVLYFLLPVLRVRMPMIKGLGTLLYFDFYFLSYFLLGMLISFLKKRYQLESFARSPLATIAAVLAVVVLFGIVPAEAGLLVGTVLGLPLLLIVFGNSFFGLLRTKPLVLLGQISYSTYLLHGVVLFVVNKLLPAKIKLGMTPTMFWAVTALNGIIVVALSSFSYRYFEAPFMHGYGTKQNNAVDR